MNLDLRQGQNADETAADGARTLLCKFVDENAAPLLGILRVYVRKANIATPGELQDAAKELMNDVLIEALEHAERFDVSRAPMAWLLGIAANLIRRRRDKIIRRARKEILFSETQEQANENSADDRVWATLARLAFKSQQRQVEADGEAQWMLSLVSEEDRHILRQSVIEQMDYKSIGDELGIREGAARVRAHRAINRLRDALRARTNKQGGEANE